MNRATRPSPLDAILYHDPLMRVGFILHLSGQAPPLDHLAAHVRKRLDELPSFSLTLKGRGTKALWCHQPPDLDHHLRAVELPAGADVYDSVRELHKEPFADDRPPWTMTLLHGQAPGQYSIFYRINHGLQDGGAIARTLEVLFATEPIDALASSAVVHGSGVPPRPAPRHYAYAAKLLARSTAKSLLWPHPEVGYSTERVFHWTVVPTTTLRNMAHAHGGSVNDAFVATLARTASQWAARHHPHYDGTGLPVMLAINNRRPTVVDAPGNRASTGRFKVPGHLDPLARTLEAVVAATRPLKQPPYREAVRRLSENIPPSVIDRSFRSFFTPERAAVCSSNVSIRHPLALAGTPVHAIDGVTVLPLGAPVSVALISYQGSSRAVFVTDPVLPDTEELHQEWSAAVADAPPQATNCRS
ncbi:wax ester/triacylglycerol synthase domain-containing protein [Streptomyces natalensis]|uniref:O-acyltransferase WSD1-like N-terminal domain-containing protein n=1 Tax=Streptomyces natalensis ATCC 27448 TaxID=1240678 RepID=A0A0D7CNR9_9ACTN|nr:wax ester/triacylglycerol synthase domain-containing protein [Streptomyces natalensis]KIZ17848.1 hypothetical protein SNA_11315 [Streptomyces natalensis ATCC 27448]